MNDEDTPDWVKVGDNTLQNAITHAQKENIELKLENERLKSELDKAIYRSCQLKKALIIIHNWNQCSAEYRMDFGSNGERDYYRRLAKDAIDSVSLIHAEK